MSYTTKNYSKDGGDTLVIGGTLEIIEIATVKGLPQAANQQGSTATTIADLKNDFNSLISKLKQAKLMTLDE